MGTYNFKLHGTINIQTEYVIFESKQSSITFEDHYNKEKKSSLTSMFL